MTGSFLPPFIDKAGGLDIGHALKSSYTSRPCKPGLKPTSPYIVRKMTLDSGSLGQSWLVNNPNKNTFMPLVPGKSLLKTPPPPGIPVWSVYDMPPLNGIHLSFHRTTHIF